MPAKAWPRPGEQILRRSESNGHRSFLEPDGGGQGVHGLAVHLRRHRNPHPARGLLAPGFFELTGDGALSSKRVLEVRLRRQCFQRTQKPLPIQNESVPDPVPVEPVHQFDGLSPFQSEQPLDDLAVDHRRLERL